MTDIKRVNALKADNTKNQWLDRLWLYLFDGDNSGLMSPGQIRRERRDRDRVRQFEMQAILEAEQDINDIHRGLKSLDDDGNVIDTPPVEAVSTHRIIENTAIEQDFDTKLSSPAHLLRSAAKEISVRELERSLNIRKIAIQAEHLILTTDEPVISTKPISAEWLSRWREAAENVYNAELQPLWAKIIVYEIANPGSYSLGLMATLHQLTSNELEMVRIISKYTFTDFIFNAEHYFDEDFHHAQFEVMEELGLLNTLPTVKNFKRESLRDGFLYLVSGRKALQIGQLDRVSEAKLPIIKLSRVGRQLFSLCKQDADLAYLFEMAKFMKGLGLTVSLGDWESVGVQNGHFNERMAL